MKKKVSSTDVKKLEVLYTVSENVKMVQLLWESMEVPQKIKTRATI
jgi:hypothetical protein